MTTPPYCIRCGLPHTGECRRDAAVTAESGQMTQGHQSGHEKPSASQPGGSNDLRTRIAAAMHREKVGRTQLHSYEIDILADAVIRELERHKSWWALPADPWKATDE